MIDINILFNILLIVVIVLVLTFYFYKTYKSEKKPTKKYVYKKESDRCICDDVQEGKASSGWCRKHHTDWI